MANQLLFAENRFSIRRPGPGLHAACADGWPGAHRDRIGTRSRDYAAVGQQPSGADDCNGPPHRRKAGSSPLSSPCGASIARMMECIWNAS